MTYRHIDHNWIVMISLALFARARVESIGSCAKRQNCEPRHARRVMQDLITCTISKLATVALHLKRNRAMSRAAVGWPRVQLHPTMVAIACTVEVRHAAGQRVYSMLVGEGIRNVKGTTVRPNGLCFKTRSRLHAVCIFTCVHWQCTVYCMISLHCQQP